MMLLASLLALSSAVAVHWRLQWRSPRAPQSLPTTTMLSALSSLRPQPRTKTRTLARQWRLKARALAHLPTVQVNPPQPPCCCHRAAAVTLCTATTLRAVATAADTAAASGLPPSFRQRCAGALPPMPMLHCHAAATAADAATAAAPPPSCR